MRTRQQTEETSQRAGMSNKKNPKKEISETRGVKGEVSKKRAQLYVRQPHARSCVCMCVCACVCVCVYVVYVRIAVCKQKRKSHTTVPDLSIQPAEIVQFLFRFPLSNGPYFEVRHVQAAACRLVRAVSRANQRHVTVTSPRNPPKC